MWTPTDSHKLHRQSVAEHLSNVRQYREQYPYKYHRAFNYAYDKWEQLCEVAQKTKNNIADMVADRQHIPYPVAQDLVQSVCIMRATGA